MTFQELVVGQTFDFIGNHRYNSFHDRCRKISARKYESIETQRTYTIGSIKAIVFNVGLPPKND